MWFPQHLICIFLLTTIFQVESAKTQENSLDDDTLCNQDTIKKAVKNLENSKLEIYHHIDEPGFNKIMADYGSALKIFKAIADNIIKTCSHMDLIELREYLEGHLNMEQCSEALLNEDDEKIEEKCPLLEDQGNINCVVNFVVNGTEGFDRILEYCNNTKASTDHKILVYNALSQECQAGVENYQKLYYQIRFILENENNLTKDDIAAFGDIIKNTIWSAFKNNPPIAYPELIADIYSFNGILGQRIARDLVVEAVNKKVDILQLQLLIEHIPSLSCKIRAYLYLYGHISDYPNADEAKFRLAYPMYALKQSPDFSRLPDAQLKASLSAAYDSLPEYAKEFMDSGEICFELARMEGLAEEKKSEDVFIKINAGFRKTTNEYLFVTSENGTKTRCDRSGVVSYFFKAGPPADISLVKETNRTSGDFHLAGTEGVDCATPYTSRNVYFCSLVQYMLSNFQYHHDDFLKFAKAHAAQHADKFREKCGKAN